MERFSKGLASSSKRTLKLKPVPRDCFFLLDGVLIIEFRDFKP